MPVLRLNPANQNSLPSQQLSEQHAAPSAAMQSSDGKAIPPSSAIRTPVPAAIRSQALTASALLAPPPELRKPPTTSQVTFASPTPELDILKVCAELDEERLRREDVETTLRTQEQEALRCRTAMEDLSRNASHKEGVKHRLEERHKAALATTKSTCDG